MGLSVGWQKFLLFKKETTWGTDAGSSKLWLPYETYDVKPEPQFYQGQTFTGGRQRIQPNQPVKSFLRGNLNCDMYGRYAGGKSLAEWWVALALSAPNGIDLDSMTVDYSEPNDGKRHRGLRVNQMVISGQDGGPVKLQLQLEGKEEDGGISISAPAATIKHGGAFRFMDSTFTIGGSAVSLASFQITVKNNLIPDSLNSYWPTSLSAGRREVEWQFTLRKTDDTYDALLRAQDVEDVAAVLTLKGTHEGTGPVDTNFTTAEIAFDLTNHMGNTSSGGLNELISVQANYMVLKPATTDNDIDVVWGSAA